ncbi:DUF2093 domain-containing protein [Altererythrobacter lauratis]|uniref:DUF2093 domain-containing protein n=1 Tax=Alteraurantiacibacter lauratis TaxID=2054627 RepID=A0ABV7EEJ4_9SPHN
MLMSASDQPATLIYGPNGFRVIRHGQYVVCAVSGEKIALDELRYWSVERQEPYASAEISTRRALEGE